MIFFDFLQTEFGWLRIVGDSQALYEIVRIPDIPAEIPHPGGSVQEAMRELTEYFSGSRCNFTLPRIQRGTAFQETVWQALTEIPYRKTISYQALAARIGQPGASRAVGNAVGANPWLILVPCHRVIRGDGTLGGFSAGLDAKRILHRIEGIVIPEKTKVSGAMRQNKKEESL